VKNHPFVDDNKRIGFILGVLFLELNSKNFIASEEGAAASVIALAEGSWDEAGYAAYLRENIADA
jgi:death-on-curing protein